MTAQRSPDVSYEQRIAAELIKRIRKLRWIGMDEEAHRMVRFGLHLCTGEVIMAQPHERAYGGFRRRLD
jgi:hypothetical protein